MIAGRRRSISRGQVSLVTGMERAAQIARSRLLFAAVVFAVSFVVMAARVIDVAIFNDGNEPRLARVTAAAPLATGRADIVDRNGVLLATSLRAASLYANPTEIIDPAAAAAQLTSVLIDLNPAHVAAKLVQPKRFVWIKRHLTPAETFAVNRLGIPGLHFQTEERRVYPHGALSAHVTGFSGVDDTGLAGLEKALDSRIRGDQTPVRTSIDVRLQHIVRQEVQRQIDDFTAIGGVGVVMAVDSGEVHALVSLPDFDPNRAEVTPPEARFNRATLGVYEMGSTFKIFNTAMALESGAVTLRDGYDATKPIRIARFTISDYHAQKRWLSVPEIFIYSSNIGSVQIALDVGTEEQRAFLARLGFLDRLTLELPETGTPMTPRPWRQINTMTISYGHGLSVTPLHLAGAVSTVVNGGMRHAPTLLAQDTPATGQRVFSAETSEAMRRLLRLVVKSGTGRKADARGFLVGGKTGTAEKSGVGGYRRRALLSSFVAAFPLNAPKFVILVMVDEPKGNERSHGYATGGWVAAPAVKRIVARMAPLYGILPINENAPEIRRDLELKLPTPKGGNHLASF